MVTEIERYLRKRAPVFGIDPEYAVRVARSEGGLNDPIRQSNVIKNGVREPSYGPLQLLIGGEGTGFPAGMGNDALRAGIDPRDPNQWQQALDFGLQHASKNGWGAWYGAKAAGIGNYDGIRGLSMSGMPSKMPEPGQLNPPIMGGREIADAPVAGILAAPAADAATTPDPSVASVFRDKGMAAGLEALAGNDKAGKGFDALLAGLGGGSSSGRNAQAEAHATPLPSNIGAYEAADASRMANAQQMMTQLLAAKRKRVPGMSLMG